MVVFLHNFKVKNTYRNLKAKGSCPERNWLFSFPGIFCAMVILFVKTLASPGAKICLQAVKQTPF
jgi:hypothetical protein